MIAGNWYSSKNISFIVSLVEEKLKYGSVETRLQSVGLKFLWMGWTSQRMSKVIELLWKFSSSQLPILVFGYPNYSGIPGKCREKVNQMTGSISQKVTLQAHTFVDTKTEPCLISVSSRDTAALDLTRQAPSFGERWRQIFNIPFTETIGVESEPG